MQPARRVVTRSPHRTVGIIACSWLQDQGIEYESQLERRFIQRSLVFPYVKRIFHQPFKIPYTLDGKDLLYTPDFLLILKDGQKIVVEVKPKVFVEKNRRMLCEARSFLSSENILFFVITDKEIDDGNAAINAALLLRYARGGIAEQVFQRCMDAVNQATVPLTLEHLMSAAEIAIGDVSHLIARGYLCIPPHLSLTPETLITNPNFGDQNGTLLFRNWFNATPW